MLGVEAPPPDSSLDATLADHPALAALITETVRSGEPLRRREVVLTRADRTVTLGLTVHLLRRDADGGPAVRGFLVLFADLTEARQRAEEARLADNLMHLGEMAAGAAHELRNSLATLRGYLTLIERTPEGESSAGHLEEVRHEADHLQRVLEDFLSFARPGRGRVESVDLATVAARAAADPALEGRVRLEVDPTTPLLSGDQQLLEHSVRNLLRNALEAQLEAGGPGRDTVGDTAAQPGSSPVDLSVRPLADGGAELVVADRGPGVAPEIADRLFQPFATSRPGGVGLGLALAHRIVSLHGGSLRLEPRGGGGTRAVMRFPAGRNVSKGNDRGPGSASSGADQVL